MEGRHDKAIQDMDKASFELLLAERLKDSTPAALCKDHSYSHRHSGQFPPHLSPSLRTATERRPSQPPDLALPTHTDINAVPTNPPQRKESSLSQCEPSLHGNHNHLQHYGALIRESATTYPVKLMADVAAGQVAPEAGSELSPTSGHEIRRGHVLCELMSTEEAYVSDLKTLVAVFAVPLCEYAGSRALQMEPILHPLQTLFVFQHRFLRMLRRATGVVAVARLFAAEAAGFEAYVGYCSQYHWLCGTLDLLETEPEWASFLSQVQKEINVHCGKRRLGVRDFLIKPVQRICKYPLFLKDLVKHTDPSSETGIYTELTNALALVRGVCEAIDLEQQHVNSMRLRQAVLANYSDTPELPLSMVSKLGSIILSGPLRVVSYNGNGPNTLHTLGCVLFRRFFIVLKPKRSAMLLPQFWFPLHTMQLADDGVLCSWRLAHIGSGQSMGFEARSDGEKRMWMAKLDEAISASMARVVARRTRRGSGRNPALVSVSLPAAAIHSNHSNAAESTDSPFPQPPSIDATYRGAASRDIGDGRTRRRPFLTTSEAAANDPIAPTATFSHRSFWQYGLASESKNSRASKRFEAMTSPEILRLSTLAKIKQGPLSRADSHGRSSRLSPPTFRLPSTQKSHVQSHTAAALTTRHKCRMSAGSNPSHNTAVEPGWVEDAGSDCEGSFMSSGGSTCHEPARSQCSRQQSLSHQDCRRPNKEERRAELQAEQASTEGCATVSLPRRLIRLLGHLAIRKHQPECALGHAYTGECARIDGNHSRSFDSSGPEHLGPTPERTSAAMGQRTRLLCTVDDI